MKHSTIVAASMLWITAILFWTGGGVTRVQAWIVERIT